MRIGFVNNWKITLLSILLLAFVLRIWDIGGNPPSLYGDELTIAYDAYSILKTGQDQTGLFFPLTFPMGAGRPAGYVYFSVPFVALFGPNAIGVRAPSVLSGLLIIVLIFFLARKLIDTKVGLIAAFLAAISPWGLSLSRGGFEAHFALALVLSGVLFFLLAKTKPYFYLVSALCFGLTIHTYPTYKLTLLFLVILLFWFEGGIKELFNIKLRIYSLSFLIILAFFGFLSIQQTLTAGSETRFFNINVFSKSDLSDQILQRINSERNLNTLPDLVSRVFHNKPIEYLMIVGESYLKNFSLDFIFLHGDKNPRHNMANIGGLYFVEFITLVLGLIYLASRFKKILLFLLAWIALSPIATALLLEPHMLRSSLMLPPLILISATGLSYLILLAAVKKMRFILTLLGFFFLIQFLFFAEKFYFLSPNLYSNFWAYPAKLASKIAFENKNNYNFIILSSRVDDVEYAYPLYNQIQPELVIAQNKNPSSLNSLKFKKYENIYIGQIPDSNILQFIADLPGSVLYIGSPFEQSNLDKYIIENGLDGLKALIIVEKK